MAVAAPGYGGFAPMAPAARLAGLERLEQRREKWFTQLAEGVGELRERAETKKFR